MSDELVDSGEVLEIPFEDACVMLQEEAYELMEIAREQLRENYEKKGDGWQYEEARYHFWKGIDELYSANHAVKEGDIKAMEQRIADGWNHILMASYVAYSEEEGSVE